MDELRKQKRDRETQFNDYHDKCGGIPGISKDSFMEIIKSYDDCQEAYMKFGYILFNGNVFNIISESQLHINAYAEISYCKDTNLITWIWDEQSLTKIKQAMSEEQLNEFKYYLRKQVEFHEDQHRICTFMRYIGIYFLSSYKFVEYSSKDPKSGDYVKYPACYKSDDILSLKKHKTNMSIFVPFSVR